ncbi:MAG: potassium transporter Trk [Actinobacteria bacterium HGW-Actinobacteria-11]|nr:MAG: potassium transporter Trk [Actinobacteria bacterium HGW-Actinobacteria-11]TFB17244.1 TrkH family potassium uptake protein [Microbacterium sp. 3H14]
MVTTSQPNVRTARLWAPIRWIADFPRRSPARASIAVFVLAAVLFTALLRLPFAAADGVAAPWEDATFTASSAVTVTGLTSVDTGTSWSLFGHIVILLAIQTGGLGIVTVALLLTQAVTRRLGLGGRVFAQQVMGATPLGDVKRLLKIVVLTTFIIEGALCALLLPAFIVEDGWVRGPWHALFYSISAFNNAGFVLDPGGLAVYSHNVWIMGVLMVGVIAGSLGFPVYLAVIAHLWGRGRWSLHTKLTVTTTLVLFLVGAVSWGASEWNNTATIGTLNPLDRILHALFASTMMRSGGFAIVDTEQSTSTTLLLTDALMFVGGGSISTAGGIKVTTLAVLFLAIVAEARGTRDIAIFERRLPESVLRVAISVTFLGASLVLAGTVLLTLTNRAPLDHILFEVISAFATCGLSVGLSADLDPFGKFVLSALMLAGRVGPIGLAAALAVRQRTEHFTYPTDRPILG